MAHDGGLEGDDGTAGRERIGDLGQDCQHARTLPAWVRQAVTVGAAPWLGRGMTVEVRPALPGDVNALAVAHVAAWQVGYRGLMPQEYLDGLEVGERAGLWTDRLATPGEGPRTLVGTVDDEVVGFSVFGPARDAESGNDGELYALNVHPDHWSAGAGSALLVASQAGLANLGHVTATLWVVSGNVRARRFYERHGWTVEPVERDDKLPGLTVPAVRYARRLAEGAG